jgi:hypothetical protein
MGLESPRLPHFSSAWHVTAEGRPTTITGVSYDPFFLRFAVTRAGSTCRPPTAPRPLVPRSASEKLLCSEIVMNIELYDTARAFAAATPDAA